MNRDDYVLASMAMAGRDPLSPVQVQKYFFLLDQNVSENVGGAHFDFQAYDYGPFDKEVYEVLDDLRGQGLVEVVGDTWRGIRTYRLTEAGFHAAEEPIEQLPDVIQKYARDVVSWMRQLSFTQLVSAIYSEYPEMQANSVFRPARTS